MKPLQLIFDIDGTLTHSEDLHNDCYLRACVECLGEVLDPDWASFPEVTDRAIFEALSLQYRGRPCGRADLEAFRQTFLELLRQELHTHPHRCQAVPGAAEFVDLCLRQPHIRVAFATGAFLESARLKLRLAGIPQQPLHACDDRPHRVDIIRAARKTAPEADHAVILGDGPWDLAASQALGFPLVAMGKDPQDRLALAGHRVWPDYRQGEALLDFIHQIAYAQA